MKRNMKMAAVMAAALVAMAGGEALAGKKGGKTQVEGVANINTATARQLDLLPGVGEKAAERIIAYRSKAPFKRVEELRNVKGIGAKKLAKMKPHLAVSGPTTLKKMGSTAAPASADEPTPRSQGRTGRRR